MNEQRQKFLNELSRNGELRNLNTAKVVNFDKYRKNNERYTSKTTRTQTRRRARNRKNNKALKKLALIGGAGLLAFGTIIAFKNHNNALTIQEAMQEGKTLEEMGLSAETYGELEKINEIMQSSNSLSREEILDLGQDLENNELAIINAKISNALGETGYVNVNARDKNGISTIETENETFIESDGFGGDYDRGIGDYIQNIANLQTNNSLYQEEAIDSDEMLKVFEESLNRTNIFAAADLTKSDNGKLKLENATSKDIQKQKQSEIEER